MRIHKSGEDKHGKASARHELPEAPDFVLESTRVRCANGVSTLNQEHVHEGLVGDVESETDIATHEADVWLVCADGLKYAGGNDESHGRDVEGDNKEAHQVHGLEIVDAQMLCARP